MFKKSLILPLSIFFFFMIFTSFIKNKTRNIEKNIEALSSEILILENELAESKIDFIYLSSPENLKKNTSNFIGQNYLSYDFSRIFLSTEDFIERKSTKKTTIDK